MKKKKILIPLMGTALLLSMASCSQNTPPSLSVKNPTIDADDPTNNGNGGASDITLPPNNQNSSNVNLSAPNDFFSQADLDWLLSTDNNTTIETKKTYLTSIDELDVTVDSNIKSANLCYGATCIAIFNVVDNKLVVDDEYKDIILSSNKRYVLMFEKENDTSLSSITVSKKNSQEDTVSLSANKTYVQLQISGNTKFSITTKLISSSESDLAVDISSDTINITVDKHYKNAKLIQGTKVLVEYDVKDGKLVPRNSTTLSLNETYYLTFDFEEINNGRYTVNDITLNGENKSSIFKSINGGFITICLGTKTEFSLTSKQSEALVSFSTFSIEKSGNINNAKLYLVDDNATDISNSELVGEFIVNDNTLVIHPNYSNKMLETTRTYILVLDLLEDESIKSIEKNNNNASVVEHIKNTNYIKIVLGVYTNFKVSVE